jgi:hypothetical protein
MIKAAKVASLPIFLGSFAANIAETDQQSLFLSSINEIRYLEFIVINMKTI